MSSPEMPADPFGAPEELITIMKGLTQIHDAAVKAGMAERTATEFISNVFIHLMAGIPQDAVSS
jgi:hypothetical protein